MSEELLKAIIELFAIVAKERITEDERANIKEFLSVHLNQDAIGYYIDLFEQYCCEPEVREQEAFQDLDEETIQFVDDWAKIMKTAKEVNKALTLQQKVVLVIKIIELIFADEDISERQENLIFYIGEALKISKKDIHVMKTFVTGQDHEALSSKDILIVDEGSGDSLTQGPRIVAKNLTGLIAILRLPEIETYFIKYLGISTLYLNGIPIKSRKIGVLPPGSTIKGNKIQPIYYSDIVSKFLTGEIKSKLTFSAEHIFYHFKSGKVGLQNINIGEEGGKLIGIMGASGSGKSTLLHVLNGMEKPSGGRVKINGVNIHKDGEKIEGVIGHVPQDDLLVAQLTVFQNLFYAARLCFSQYDKAQTEKLVNKVLQNLGLHEIRDLKVGSPLDKTISGGQRKRLNIGLELIREPMVLFVDEPTSGLSSRDSENIMDLLKELSLRGKMIFVVIHQPSSDIYKMFDSMLILDTGGLQIYYGNPAEAITYFKEIVNAANKNQAACPECGNINPEQIFDIIETRIVNEYGRLTETRKISANQWYQYFRAHTLLPKIEHFHEKLEAAQDIPNWWRQLKVFVKRDVLAKVADKQYLAINFLAAPVLALFMAFMVRYYDPGDGGESQYSFFGNENIPIYFFMSIIVALFLGMTVSAEEIFKDQQILKRERFLHLSKNSYLISKLVVLFAISAIQSLTFVWVGNFILDVSGMFFNLWLILFSCACFANMLGLNISASFRSAVTIYILIPILLIPQLLLSGVVISFDKFNPAVTSEDGVPLVGEVMASRWAFEAAMISQYKDNPFEKKFFALNQQIANAEYKKLYYVPQLKSELSFCFNNMDTRLTMGNQIRASLALLRSEIGKELEYVGTEKLPVYEKLFIEQFDSAVYQHTAKFLRTLHRYYINRYNDAKNKKDRLVLNYLASPEKKHLFEIQKKKYQNKAISALLKNNTSAVRIVEKDGELIQKIYPIYFNEHRPEHALDFREKFFVPTKHFAGFYFDTFCFNLVVIWVMSLLLFVALQFDVLKMLTSSFERDKRKKPRFK